MSRKVWIVAGMLLLFAAAGPAAAVPVGTGGAAGEGLVAVMQPLGTPIPNSVNPWRWYWSYAERFQIDFVGLTNVGCGDVTDGSDWTSIQSALDTWEGVVCSSITNSLSFTVRPDWGPLDCSGDVWDDQNFTNELGWIEDPGEWTKMYSSGGNFQSTWLGVALTYYYPATMVQAETDIYFNGEFFDWYTDTDTSGTEYAHVETVGLHELGHGLTLADVYLTDDMARVMYGYYLGEKTVLDPRDEDSLRYAYPSGDHVIPAPGALLLGMIGVGLVGAARRTRRTRT